MSMYVKLISSPKWLGNNIGKIITVVVFLWGIFTYTVGWFNGVNATVKGYPELVSRQVETDKKYESFEKRFEMFMEMYKLEVLGRKSEAQDLARSIPDHKP